MAVRPNLIGSLLGGGKWIAAGGLGAWLANNIPGIKGGAQDVAGDVGETAIEVESGVAAQNGNIDGFFAGRNAWQSIVGWLSGGAALLYNLTKNPMFAEWSNNLTNFRAAEQTVIQREVSQMGDTSVLAPGTDPMPETPKDGVGTPGVDAKGNNGLASVATTAAVVGGSLLGTKVVSDALKPKTDVPGTKTPIDGLDPKTRVADLSSEQLLQAAANKEILEKGRGPILESEVHGKTHTKTHGKGWGGLLIGLGTTVGLTLWSTAAKGDTPDTDIQTTGDLTATPDGTSVSDVLYANLPEPVAAITDEVGYSMVPYYDTINTVLDNEGILNENGGVDAEVIEAAAVDTGGITGAAAGASLMGGWGLAVGGPWGGGAGALVGGTVGYMGGSAAVEAVIDNVKIGTVELSPENKAFFDLYDSVPTTVSADMPPELQSLVELKANVVNAQAAYDESWGTNRAEIENALETAEGMYEEQLDAMTADGGIEHVVAYLSAHPTVPGSEQPVVAANTPLNPTAAFLTAANGGTIPTEIPAFNPNAGGSAIPGMNANLDEVRKAVVNGFNYN